MKTTQLKALMTVLAVLFFAKTHAQDDFVLKGKIGEWNAPAKLFLEYMVDEKQMVDSSFRAKVTIHPRPNCVLRQKVHPTTSHSTITKHHLSSIRVPQRWKEKIWKVLKTI